MKQKQWSRLTTPSAYIFVTLIIIAAMIMTAKSLLQSNFIRKAHWMSGKNGKNSVSFLSKSAKNIKSFCTAVDGPGTSVIAKKEWDVKSLKSEVNRVYLRTFKKVGKANERLDKATKEYEEIMTTDNVSLQRMEDCPNPETLQAELKELKDIFAKVIFLEEELKSIKSATDVKFIPLSFLAEELGITDTPAPKQERGPKKVKGKPLPPRKPYHIYTGLDGLEIRVGRGASDNDELSCNPEHRDGADWWMHVAGCAGSHVVIRSHDDLLPEKYRETLLDAALLSVINSKGSQSGKVAVTVTRCRQVSKPGGSKPGLVRLNGDIITIKVDVKAEIKRIERLEKNREIIAS